MKKAAGILATVVVAGLVTTLSAHRRDILVSFDGGINGTPVSSFAAPINEDNTFQNVTRNLVRGVRPAAQLWRIADLKADVFTDGRIKIRGRGLLLAGGDNIGRNANVSVVATLICQATAPFVELSSADTVDGVVFQGAVPLEPNGDFRIDETLRGRAGQGAVPSACASPVLLIRSGGNGTWLAAGILDLDNRD